MKAWERYAYVPIGNNFFLLQIFADTRRESETPRGDMEYYSPYWRSQMPVTEISDVKYKIVPEWAILCINALVSPLVAQNAYILLHKIATKVRMPKSPHLYRWSPTWPTAHVRCECRFYVYRLALIPRRTRSRHSWRMMSQDGYEAIWFLCSDFCALLVKPVGVCHVCRVVSLNGPFSDSLEVVKT